MRQFPKHIASIAVLLTLVGCEPSPHDLAGGKDNLEALTAQYEADPEIVHALNDMDKTPLHYAATYGRDETIKALIEWGADINARDITGMTPLHITGTLNRVSEARILLDAGADLEAKDDFGATPLHSAAIHEKIDVMNLFLERGADPNATNTNGKTPLDLAKEQRKAKAVERLSEVMAQ